uniref:Carbohydrate sulfotransferase n=1 Tax=Salarias fasciatus TaxID=181472 RepID=A0A672II10_SALFA
EFSPTARHREQHFTTPRARPHGNCSIPSGKTLPLFVALKLIKHSHFHNVFHQLPLEFTFVCITDRMFMVNSTLVCLSGKFVLDRIFVSDKHKILFCQTPKVGNTQWKKVLIVLNEGLVHDHDRNGLHRLSSLTPQEISHRLNTYFKFLMVRDPFERLISAFKDKFQQNPRDEPWYNEDIAPLIIAIYRKSHWDGALTLSDLHFEEFVRYLVDVGVRRQILDQLFTNRIIHWMTYTELCAPCEIQYSVVGHHETLEKDAPYILHAAGVEGLVSYPSFPPDITRYNRTKVEQYFSGISKRDIRRLFARYQSDFHLFGYPRPDFLLN